MILTSYSHYSYSKFEILIVLILNNTDDVVDFKPPWIDIYKNHKVYMLRVRTLLYSVEGCACFACCLCLFLSSSFVNTITTKIVNFDEWFESLGSFMSIISIFLNLWIWRSKRMNRTYFKCSEFDDNVVLILIATYVLINQCCMEYERVRVVEFQYSLVLKISRVLMSSDKMIHCWPLVCTYVWFLLHILNRFAGSCADWNLVQPVNRDLATYILW